MLDLHLEFMRVLTTKQLTRRLAEERKTKTTPWLQEVLRWKEASIEKVLMWKVQWSDIKDGTLTTRGPPLSPWQASFPPSPPTTTRHHLHLKLLNYNSHPIIRVIFCSCYECLRRACDPWSAHVSPQSSSSHRKSLPWVKALPSRTDQFSEKFQGGRGEWWIISLKKRLCCKFALIFYHIWPWKDAKMHKQRKIRRARVQCQKPFKTFQKMFWKRECIFYKTKIIINQLELFMALSVAKDIKVNFM